MMGMTAEGVVKLCDDGLREATRLADGIRAKKSANDTELTWDATFGAFDRLNFALQESALVPQLMGLCHPDATVRAAALTCEPRVDAFSSALYVDDEIALVLRRAALVLGSVSHPRRRFIEHVLRDYRRNGLELPVEKRAQLQALNETLTELGQAFEKNLANATLSIEVDPASLEGLPEGYVSNHPVGSNGKIRITTDTPDSVPFIRYSSDRVSARELSRLANTRARAENKPILEQILKLRHEKALLLGYATWADYVLEPRMAKSPATVRSFLERLHKGLAPRRAEEFKVFYDEAAAQGLLDANGGVMVSDTLYLDNILREKKFQLDSQALSEYFEVRTVQQGIMTIAAKLYGITFVPIVSKAWYEDVEVYDVRDADGTVLARVYLDLFPREGKYKHAAVFTLRQTSRSSGERIAPRAALVCNFPKPGIAPALLDHDQVTTFFHEFGHLLHDILSRSELASFAGTSVARDFVEAPSQMFEEWAWNRESLDVFAKQHQTGELIPEAMYQSLIASRTFGEALFTDRQLYLATLDQVYHTHLPGFDTSVVAEELFSSFSPFVRLPDICFEATFGHLIGYDAAYYGYQWALVLAFDIRSRFIQEGIMNPSTAASYRSSILEPGGSEEESDLVQHFLGRPSNEKAYLDYLGIE